MKRLSTFFILMVLFTFRCDDPGETIYDPLSLEIVATSASAPTTTDGALNLTVSGGKPPYTYDWSNGATTEDISNLIAGIYSVTVTSDDGQSASDAAEVLAPPDTNSLTDSDGNTYPLIRLGTQVWMAENFRGRHTAIGGLLTGVYAYDDDESNVADLGRLYTWQAALDASPDGWHLPTSADWDTLAAFLGFNAGSQLKIGGGSGFNATLGGYRNPGGGYEHVDWWGMYWTATYSGLDHASARNLFSDQTELIASGVEVEGAISVRYVRD